MPPPFEVALSAAVDLLRSLPRSRSERSSAKSRFAEFMKLHPQTPARILVDARPGSPTVDYDIMLEHPENGTVGVTWCRDDGSPWSITYADHWASNLVLSVDDGDVTVQEALLSLKMAIGRTPSLMDRLIDEKIVALATEADPPPVELEEIQAAADAFRRANDLLTADSMHAQLSQWGISLEHFQQLLSCSIRSEKFRDRLTDPHIDSFFEAHRAEFDRVRIVQAKANTRAVMDRAVQAARDLGIQTGVAVLIDSANADDLSIEFRTGFACDVLSFLAGQSLDTLPDPFEQDGFWWFAAALERHPAILDDPTREAIRAILFSRWLGEKRSAAKIRWHWL